MTQPNLIIFLTDDQGYGEQEARQPGTQGTTSQPSA